MATLTPTQIASLQAADHDDKRSVYMAGNAICLAFAVISVVLRFWSRRIARTHIGPDDWLILAATLITGIYTSLLIAIAHFGMGRHAWWMTDVKTFAQLSLSAETMYNVSIPATKLSILFLYKRIFPQPWFHRTLIGLGSFIIAYSIAQIFGDIFQCIPVSSLWGATTAKYCIDYPKLIISMGVVNTVTDIVMLALPIPLLWNLNLSVARKRLLTGLFLMGGFVCIVSIVRLFYVERVGKTVDPGWDYIIPSTMSGLECCVGIISANLPTYRPLVSGAFRKKESLGTANTSKAANSYAGGQDSLNIPLRTLFTQQGSGSHSQIDDEEELFNKGGTKTEVLHDGTIQPGSKFGEIQVTKSFHHDHHKK